MIHHASVVDSFNVRDAGQVLTWIDMSTRRYTVTCHWDQEARVWYVAETDVPGLATESATVEEMEEKLLRMVPELLALNETPGPSEPVSFELITRKDELAQCA